MLIILTLIGVVATKCFAEDNILFAAVLYRHGDRTPIMPYPTDPWKNESLWPVKFGELTNIGKTQHFALGQWLRKRYSHLLSDQFDPTEIYIQSSDIDRTLMSAQVNLAGMYPPVNNSVWNKDLMWQPIPVHTKNITDDNVIVMTKPCLAYDKAKQKYINSKEYKQRLSKYGKLMDYLSANTGYKVTNYRDVLFIYNTLLIESTYNFTLPNWTNSVFPDAMKEAGCYGFRLATATPLLAKLRVGPFLQQVISYMLKASNSSQITRDYMKVLIFSAHDDTVGDILNGLNMFDGNCPPYTATIFIELLQDNTTLAQYVRISYRNSTELAEPHVLHIPYCGQNCPLNEYLKLHRDFYNFNWDRECQKVFHPLPVGMALYFGMGIIILVYVLHLLAMRHLKKCNSDRVFDSERISYNKCQMMTSGDVTSML